MFRGLCTFRCDDCGCKFTAPDFEFAATNFTTPQPCPKCGSKHTWPSKLTGFLGKYDPQRIIYKQIWQNMDEQ